MTIGGIRQERLCKENKTGHNRGAALVLGLYMTALIVSGCARLAIPAPVAPVTPVAEPVVEDSTITLPITFQVQSVAGELDKMLQQEGGGADGTVAARLQRFLQRQASKLDTRRVENAYVHQLAGKALKALLGPIKLQNDLTLLLNPKAALVSPFTEHDGTLSVVLGLVARPKIIAGNVPATPNRSFPDISLTQEPLENGFHIAITSELGFDYLSRELTARLAGTSYPVHGETAIIERVMLSASGEALIMAVNIKGSIRGTLYVVGIPAYDDATRTMWVKNIDYTVETKAVLGRVADWLLHAKLRDSLAAHARWYIGDKLDAEKDILSQALNRSLNQQVSMSGKLSSLRPAAVNVTATSIKAIVIADGTVEMKVF